MYSLGILDNYLNIEAPRLISEVCEGQPVVLVDHNEFSQSADGIEKDYTKKTTKNQVL